MSVTGSRKKTPWHWVKIGFWIGLGFCLAQLLFPLALVATPIWLILLASFFGAVFYNQLRNLWLFHIALRRRDREI